MSLYKSIFFKKCDQENKEKNITEKSVTFLALNTVPLLTYQYYFGNLVNSAELPVPACINSASCSCALVNITDYAD